MANRWTKKEIKILIKKYRKHIPNIEIAKELNKSTRAITCKANHLGLKKDPSIVTLKYSGKYISRGGNSSGTFRRAARRILRNLGYNLNGKAIHHIDRDFTNNSLPNLQILTRGEHTALHNKSRNISNG